MLPVELSENAAGGGVLGVGFVGVADVDGRGEESGDLGEELEFGADELLSWGLGIVDEGVVGAVDVAAFPEEADGGAEFADLWSEVALGVFAHSVFSFSC